MAIIDLPEVFPISSLTWSLDSPASLNQSVYSGATAVAANPWFGRWSFKVTMAPIVGEKNVLSMRAFLAALRGQVNCFRLPVTEGGQLGLPKATVTTTAAKGSNAMTLSGAFVQPGHMVTVNDQLLQIVTSAPSGANCATTFEPALRADATAGTAVQTGNPTCLVRLTGSARGGDVNQGQIYSFSLSLQEAF